jgi:hypothetical protein
MGLLERLTYKPLARFRITTHNGVLFVQHGQPVYDIDDGKRKVLWGRKMYISEHMTEEEMVRTIGVAILLFETHEMNEHYCLDGQKVLDPHPEGARP